MFRVRNKSLLYSPLNPRVPSRASALATDCEVEVFADPKNSMTELVQNEALGITSVFLPLNNNQNVLGSLGQAFEQIFNAKYGVVDRLYGIASASTDFVGAPSPKTDILRFADNPLHQGNVTYGILSPSVPTRRF